MPKRSPQLSLFKKDSSAHGGTLFTTRKARARTRPLSTRQTMHLVLRSTKATGEWSFRQSKNRRAIEAIVAKFSQKFGVRVLKLANVGNHLHFHIKLSNRHLYRPFIRAVTAAIAMAVSGRTRWSVAEPRRPKNSEEPAESATTKTAAAAVANKATNKATNKAQARLARFWDYRPFTRVIMGYRDLLQMKDYLTINQLEGLGVPRREACLNVAFQRAKIFDST